MLILLAELHLHLHLTLLQLIPMEVPPPSPGPTSGAVYPQRGNGMAASLLGGFFGVGVLIAVAILMGTKPRNRLRGR
jgi:hypothetical protein